MTIKALGYMRKCAGCRRQRELRGGYVSARLFLCADCRAFRGK